MTLAESFVILFPHLAALVVGCVVTRGSAVRVEAGVAAATACCPGCGERSRKVHSRYRRSLLDVAVGGREVVIDLLVRRFFCNRMDCGRKTFAEQVDDLTVPYARHTVAAQH